MTASSRQVELGAFVRSRRERLDATSFDLVSVKRRRTPGLRREEVAQLAGISVTWYTWLEQGREISVSEQVLSSLARTLRLNDQETLHLYGLAGARAPVRVPDEVSACSSMQRLVDALDPNPSYVLSASWRLLAWNQAEAGLIGDPGLLAESERNLLWLVFTDPAMRRLMIDWKAQAHSIVAQYRACVGQSGADEHSEQLIAQLMMRSADFRELWELHDVAGFGPAQWQFHHPRVGQLTLEYLKLSSMETQGVMVFTLLPADDATARKLPSLVAGRRRVAAVGAR